jgi:ribosome modulation factor
MIKNNEDAYENGYNNGICFAYIPDMTEEQKIYWCNGYRDAINKGKK